jgi:acyl-CoA reductase-like NAD-dependent aldehyde dehydrogenase
MKQECLIETSVINNGLNSLCRVLVGGKRDGCFYDATILEDVDPKMEARKFS